MSTSWPLWARTSTTAFGIVLGLLAQREVVRRPDSATGWLLFAAAAAIVALAVRYPAVETPAGADYLPSTSAWWRALFWFAALAAAGAAALLTVPHRSPWPPLGLWAAGLAAGTIAAWHWRVSPTHRVALPWTRLEIWALSAILLVAVIFRTLWLETIPPHFPDESRVGMFLKRAYGLQVPHLFTMGWNTWSVLGMSAQGLFAPALGLHTLTLRLFSALMGTAAVLATHLVARELFNPRLALFAAFLLAVGRTAVEFSRLGICHSQVLFLEPLAFFLWWRGVNTGRAASYLWAGISLGLCWYGYNAGQFPFPFWFGWAVLCTMTSPRTIRTHWRGAALTLLGFLLAAFPWLFHLTDRLSFGPIWAEFTGIAHRRQVLDEFLRLWQQNGFAAATELARRQIWWTWLGFTALRDSSYGLGYRGGGMLDLVTAPLFVLGLGTCLVRFWRPRFAFVLLWWLMTMLVGGVLTESPPAFVRQVGLLPALAILAALPLEGLVLTAGVTRRGTFVSLAVVGLLLAGAGWDNWRTYLGRDAEFRPDANSDLAEIIRKSPPATTFYLLGTEHYLQFYNELFLIEFCSDCPPATRDPKHLDIFDPPHLLPVHARLDTPLALVLGPTQLTLARHVQRLYPKAVVEGLHASTSELTFRIVRLSPDDLLRRTGLQMVARDAQDATRPSVVADPFDSAAVPAGATRMDWKGLVYWPTDRPATLTVEASAALSLRIGTITIANGHESSPSRRSTVELPQGWHPLVIEEPVTTPRQLSLGIETANGTHPLTRWDLRPDALPEGLLAVYERNGQPLLRRIDPQLNSYATEQLFNESCERPVTPPFIASWKGALRIEQAGTHEFEAIGSGPYSVSIDGAPLFDERDVLAEQPRTVRATRNLPVGTHELTARWDSTKPSHTSRRVFQLYWTPPGGERELVPPSAFLPTMPQ